MYPPVTAERIADRRALAPGAEAAFRALGEAVFQDGALDRRTKELIAVAVGHATQCPYGIRHHARAARRAGASREQVMEAIWVAAEMRAGAAAAHAMLAMEAMDAAEEGPAEGAGTGPGTGRSGGDAETPTTGEAP